VLTNTAGAWLFGQVLEPNEDWDEANALAERFGVTFTGGSVSAGAAWSRASTP